MPARHPIRLPTIISERLQGSECNRLVEDLLASFADWITRNETVFFRDYTDHGPRHIEDVLETACALMTPSSADRFTAEDACLLTCASVIHDCALHLQEPSFLALVKSDADATVVIPEIDSECWPTLWARYVSEVGRLSQNQLQELFGVTEPIQIPDLAKHEAWTQRHFSLIGEFLRRHHHRLGHEIAVAGIPDADGTSPLDVLPKDDPLRPFLDLAGLIARSHGTSLRSLFSYLGDHYHLRKYNKAHPIYIMVLLRIADYLQIQTDRAPAGLKRVKRLRSPISTREWGVHASVKDIVYDQHDDPETVEIAVDPHKTPIDTFLRIREWLNGIQTELDTSWAVLGEVYGRFPEKDLGLIIRRVRSNIDHEERFGTQAGYVPRRVAFSAADAELLKLLIKPLYGDRPEIAIRELVQNGVDAVRERTVIEGGDDMAAGVTVRVKANDNNTWSLIVEDAGVGMTFDTLKSYFLNAGASFRTSMVWKRQFLDDHGRSTILRSGRFGVGALAAFLVADDPTHVVLHVTTRHCLSPPESGLSFEAPLTDRPIAIRHVKCPRPGTRIEVITGSPPAFMKVSGKDRAQSDKWDWYCLDWPVVRRFAIDGEELSQRTRLPSSASDSPAGYHWIEPAGYTGVCWTYFKEAPALVCNGLIVTSSRTGLSAPIPDLEKGQSATGEVSVKMPALSVYDKDGRLPLTLDRLRVDYERISFLDALRGDVVKNIVAFLVVCAPEDFRAADVFNAKRGGQPLKSHPAIEGSVPSIPWIFTTEGVVVSDPDLAAGLKLRSLIEFATAEDARRLAPQFESNNIGVSIAKKSMFARISEGKHPAFTAAQHGSMVDRATPNVEWALQRLLLGSREGFHPSSHGGRSNALGELRQRSGRHEADASPSGIRRLVGNVSRSVAHRASPRRDMTIEDFKHSLHACLSNASECLGGQADGWLRRIEDTLMQEIGERGKVEARDLDVLAMIGAIEIGDEVGIARELFEYVRYGETERPVPRTPSTRDEFIDRLRRACVDLDGRLRGVSSHHLREIYERTRDTIEHSGVTPEAAEVLKRLESIDPRWMGDGDEIVEDIVDSIGFGELERPETRSPATGNEFIDRLQRACGDLDGRLRGVSSRHLREIYERTRDTIERWGVTPEAAKILKRLESIDARTESRFEIQTYLQIEKPVLDWNDLKRRARGDEDWFVAEYQIDIARGGAGGGFLARIWTEYIRLPLIPYSLEERKARLAHLWEDAVFKRHLEEWQAVRA